MSRSELASHLERKGFSVTSTVTKDCYALISGGDTSSAKYNKASAQNTTIIDYWENQKEVMQGTF